MPTLNLKPLLLRRTFPTPTPISAATILSPPRQPPSLRRTRWPTSPSYVTPSLLSTSADVITPLKKNILKTPNYYHSSDLNLLSPQFSSSSSLSSSSVSVSVSVSVSCSASYSASLCCLNCERGEMGGENRKRNGVVGVGVDCVSRNGVVSSLTTNSVNNDGDDDHDRRGGGGGGGGSSEECNKLITLPTLLTLARVAAIPLFIATFYVNSSWGTTATTSIFVAAAITDWLDGYLARKMRLGTVFGAFLDPVADKLMVAATLVLLCSRPPETALFGDVPWLFPVPAIAIIGREITMSAVREWAASQNTKLLQAVAVNNLGKWKTATQMTALTILVATRDSRLAGSETLAASGVALLYISAGLAVWSLVVYMRKIWKVLLR